MITARSIEPGPEEYAWLEQGLRKVGLFASFGRAELGAILPYMLMLEYPGDYDICEEGELGDALYLIYKGTVLVTKKGWDKPVACLEDGNFIGEMALIFSQPRSATVTTQGKSLIFCLSSIDFKRVLEQHPHLKKPLADLAEARLRELKK